MRFTKNGLLPTIALCTFAITMPVHAQNKCVVNGKTTYQDKPCTTGAQTFLDTTPSIGVSSGRPPAAQPQRDAPIPKKAWRAAPATEAVQQARMTGLELLRYLEESGNISTVKGEFETTAAFEQRKRELRQPRAFSFEPDFLVNNFTYDADTQTMAVDFDQITQDKPPSFTSYYSAPEAVRNRSLIRVPSDGKSKESEYVGTNAFGAKRTIQQYKGNSVGLLPVHLMPTPGEAKILIKMPPAEAQTFKSYGRYRIIGSLQANEPVVKWTYKKEATFSDPLSKDITYIMGSAQIERIEVLSREGKTLAAIERVR